MKKLIIFSILSCVVIIGLFFASSCKKKEATVGCSSGSYGGISQEPKTNVMFWISKDLGCGTIKITKIQNESTNDESFYYATGSGTTIDRFYYAQPGCGSNATGTITVQLYSGYSYRYTATCSGGAIHTGEMALNCDGTCQAIEIK